MRRSLSALLAAGLLAAGTLAAAPAAADTAPTSTPAPAPADPVIIVGGTTAPAALYVPMAMRLNAQGHRAFVWALPGGGLQDIRTTTAAFADYVDLVRAATGAAEVDLVGHSQGGLVAVDYVKRAGGADVVDTIVTLGTPHHGTVEVNHADAAVCHGAVACEQMAVGSRYLVELAKVPLPGDVRVTTLSTSHDELVRPLVNASMRKGATNVVVQEQCPTSTVGHVELAYSGLVHSGVRAALDGRPVVLDCAAP